MTADQKSYRQMKLERAEKTSGDDRPSMPERNTSDVVSQLKRSKSIGNKPSTSSAVVDVAPPLPKPISRGEDKSSGSKKDENKPLSNKKEERPPLSAKPSLGKRED